MQYELLISCLLVFLTMLLYVLKNLLVALFFINQNPKIKVLALQSIVTFSISIPINISFFISWLYGFEFETIELLYGTIIGFVGAFILFLSVFVVVKGKAGAADALVETNIFI